MTPPTFIAWTQVKRFEKFEHLIHPRSAWLSQLEYFVTHVSEAETFGEFAVEEAVFRGAHRFVSVENMEIPKIDNWRGARRQL
jgi:hypothetical protein